MAGKKAPEKAGKGSKAIKKALKSSARQKMKKKLSNTSKQAEKPKSHQKIEKPSLKQGLVTEHVECIVEKIRNLEIQGGNNIAEAAVGVLKYISEKSTATSRKAFLDELSYAADRLKCARPTEPALRNAVNSVLYSIERYELKSIDNIRRYARKQMEKMLDELGKVVATISRIGSEEIRDGDIILTHCHSEHVVEILKKAKEKRKKFRVIVTETRPLNQGLATAKELAAAHIETTYIVDSAVSSVMKQVTKVLIGCDAILADGSIVNKIGTYTIALVAEKFQTPVFVAAETLKYDRITVMGTAEPIEERGPEEVTDTKDLKGVKISNPAFDVTPASLISALITEKGIMRPELIREIAQALL